MADSPALVWHLLQVCFALAVRRGDSSCRVVNIVFPIYALTSAIFGRSILGSWPPEERSPSRLDELGNFMIDL
jgi:hypothetical protein